MIDPGFSLILSLLVAALATCMVTVTGTFAGFLLARKSFVGKDLFDSFCLLPLVLPPTVVGFFLLELLAPRGLVGQYLYALTRWSPVFSWQAAVMASTVIAFPIMVRTSRSAIESVDCAYEQVAYTLGHSQLSVFFRVTLPLAWRGIISGVILSFTRAMGEFGATLMVAGNIPGQTQTMPLAIYQATQTGEESTAIWLVLLLTLCCFVVVWLSIRLGNK